MIPIHTLEKVGKQLIKCRKYDFCTYIGKTSYIRQKYDTLENAENSLHITDVHVATIEV